MNGFLYNVAKQLYGQYGDSISELNIVLPSKRARLFFTQALSEIAERPLWQPTFLSVDDIMRSLSGLGEADRIRLISELYKVYSLWHTEDFDSFYHWGEVLLTDFDTIDKYLINPDAIFSNIDDLKKIDERFLGLSDEQIALIEKFWGTFTLGTLSKEQKHFKTIWESLLSIYKEFTRRIKELGVGYGGMVYRDAIGHLSQCSGQYAFVGFNALNECEKKLFKHLKKSGQAQFFWDYDEYYYQNRHSEAGMFIRENIRLFGSDGDGVHSDEFMLEKDINVVATPSDVLQSRYVGRFLEQIPNADRETAIVLTDENMLTPVLHSIPPHVAEVNITMGYPLRNTQAYTLVERLIELQRRKNEGRFYHSDISGLLGHPYIYTAAAEALAREIADSGAIYVSADRLTAFGSVFRPVAGWMDFSAYITSLLESLTEAETTEPADTEFIGLIADEVIKLENTLRGCGIEMSDRIYFSLLRRVLQGVRVAYEGEPIHGIQVMGILETRNLDFDNVVILSMTDDIYPGKKLSSSFVPYNLRLAYGLPTPQHHEAMYSYYFYRLLQRAKNIHIVYSSKSDDSRSGEPSRYIYQLDYESPHNVERTSIALTVGVPDTGEISVAKTDEILGRIADYKLSPSSYYRYIECPLKFYLYVAERLKAPDEIAEEVDDAVFGSVLHGAMERLYKPFIGRRVAEPEIKAITPQAIGTAVDRAITELYLNGEPTDEYSGRLQIVRDIIVKYIGGGILSYDASQDFTLYGLEMQVSARFNVDTPSGDVSLRIGGRADRIDRLMNGRLRIVDYKTGGNKLEIKNLESLFSEKYSERNSAAFQTFLYSLIVTRSTGDETLPSLYVVRNMGGDVFSPYFTVGGEQVVDFKQIAGEFAALLDDNIRSIFDISTPFTQCTDTRTCEYCDYRRICKR